jgi:hypothetical protein
MLSHTLLFAIHLPHFGERSFSGDVIHEEERIHGEGRASEHEDEHLKV